VDFEGEYSWVDHATSLGYSTLSIDNLGTGGSDRPDPINVLQFPLQSQIILNIIHALRTGNCSNSIPRKFDKLIMVTHSYGSLHGRELAIAHPADGADAYILTATAANLVGIQTIVQTATAGSVSAYDPENLGNLPPAYMAFRALGLKDVLYSLDGEFDPELLKHDMEGPAHTFAVGELVSPKQNVTSNFTGPVLVLTGRLDPIVCDAKGNNTAQVADCGVGKKSIPGQTAEVFPNAKFDVYVPDKAGHNLNLGYSAPEVFGAAHGFLESREF
jgi:pimeloyl-ACP methyl ester carboxylesterase